jgi:hypothetical protein
VQEAVGLIVLLCLVVTGLETWQRRQGDERRHREWEDKYEGRDDQGN